MSATASWRSQQVPNTANFSVLPGTPSQHAALWRSMHGASFSRASHGASPGINIMEADIDARDYGKSPTATDSDPASKTPCMRLPPVLSMLSPKSKTNNTQQQQDSPATLRQPQPEQHAQRMRANLMDRLDQSGSLTPTSQLSPAQAWQSQQQYPRDPSLPPWLMVVRSNVASPTSPQAAGAHVLTASTTPVPIAAQQTDAQQQQQRASPSVRSPSPVLIVTQYPMVHPQIPAASQQERPPRHPNSQQTSFQQPDPHPRHVSSSPRMSFEQPNPNHGQHHSNSQQTSFQQPNPNHVPQVLHQGSFSQHQPPTQPPHTSAFSPPTSLPRSRLPSSSLPPQSHNSSHPSSLSVPNNHGSQPPYPYFPPPRPAQKGANYPASAFSPHMPMDTPPSQPPQQPFSSAFSPLPPRTSAFDSVSPHASTFSPANQYPLHHMTPGQQYARPGYSQSMPPYFSVTPAANFDVGRGRWA
jgi:hypothetical protein